MSIGYRLFLGKFENKIRLIKATCSDKAAVVYKRLLYLLLQVVEERRIEKLAKADLPSVAKLLERNDVGVLRELSAKYPIRYHVVLAYMPKKRDEYRLTDYSDTILPEGIETAPKRFAITYRNKWLIDQSDFVVTYVVHDAASDAAQFKKLAERKGKTVIELSSANNE